MRLRHDGGLTFAVGEQKSAPHSLVITCVWLVKRQLKGPDCLALVSMAQTTPSAGSDIKRLRLGTQRDAQISC